MPSLVLFENIYRRNKHRQRLGQFFVNMFFKDGESVPGLFMEINEGKAREMIRQWLHDHQYIYQLPPVRNDIYKDFL
jgi:hypothetical protein